jgi:hypothetical protein
VLGRPGGGAALGFPCARSHAWCVFPPAPLCARAPRQGPPPCHTHAGATRPRAPRQEAAASLLHLAAGAGAPDPQI